VVLTGRGPIWLYLRLAHALHGVARTLTYRAPEAGDVLVFDHTSR
jgi:CRISPR-associated Csx3 family protein